MSHIERQSIVLLPGWGFKPSSLEAIANALTPQHDVMCLDTMRVSDWAEQIPAQSIIIGHSLGGLKAMELASCSPDKVRQLVTIGSSPKFVEAPHWPGIAVAEAEKFSTMAGSHLSKLLKKFLLMCCYPNLDKTFVQTVQTHMHDAEQSHEALERDLQMLMTADRRRQLPTLAIPSLYLFGEKDSIVPAELSAEMDKLSGTQVRIIDGAGHMPMLTHPEELLSQINQFIQHV
jgi:pimeloyl-[acyl-carrier protein] methyl ester esterase